jgi:hypothetical protein
VTTDLSSLAGASRNWWEKLLLHAHAKVVRSWVRRRGRRYRNDSKAHGVAVVAVVAPVKREFVAGLAWESGLSQYDGEKSENLH